MNSKSDAGEKQKNFTVEFSVSGVTVPCDGATLILELAEANNVEIDSLCRAGTCHTCKVRLISGEVDQEVEGDFDEEERAAGYFLACSSKPRSDLVVDA